CARKQDSLDIW
nr:immunoglobulin heavy chain junction region [Macaca mulatta]